MSHQDPVAAESLLGQMSLQKPSSQLDQQIQSIMQNNGIETKDDPVIVPVSPAGRRPASRIEWRVTVAACVAASLLGVVVGRSLPERESAPALTDSKSPVTVSDSISPPFVTARQLTGDPPRVIDEGFQMHEGKPSRVFRLEGLSEEKKGSPLRKKIIVPASEI